MGQKVVNKIFAGDGQTFLLFIGNGEGAADRRGDGQTYVLKVCAPEHQLR